MNANALSEPSVTFNKISIVSQTQITPFFFCGSIVPLLASGAFQMKWVQSVLHFEKEKKKKGVVGFKEHVDRRNCIVRSGEK